MNILERIKRRAAEKKAMNNGDTERKCLVQFEYGAPVRFEEGSLEYKGMWEIENAIVEACNLAVKNFLMGDDVEVFVMFTNNEGIRRVNKEQREIDAPTDVLSFPLLEAFDGEAVCYEEDINPETDRVMLGDIIISLERAAEQAEEYGHSILREITFLALHGMLHLMGYDHEEEEREKLMFDKQNKILNELNILRN